MRLCYFKGKNFGDALNPLIFNTLLPNFFDDDPAVDFFGIGSIIGTPMVKHAKKKVIFSSGFAYGHLPKLDGSYDVICVRGPLTAKALKIDHSLAIADGALLLRELNFERQEKVYKFSFMPHWENEDKYPWQTLCASAGIHYVSPRAEPLDVLKEILRSEIVIGEAMHFVIAADALRVPWIPVKAYSNIKEFKWMDWALSLDVKYKPILLDGLYDNYRKLSSVIEDKSKSLFPKLICDLVAKSYVRWQDAFVSNHSVKKLESLKKIDPMLSRDSIFNTKTDMLLERLDSIEAKYCIG